MILKTFVSFNTAGSIKPYVTILYIKKNYRNEIDLYVTPFDNRFKGYDNNNADAEKIEFRAKELGFVEVPQNITDILKAGKFRENYNMIKPFCNNDKFLKAVEDSAGDED